MKLPVYEVARPGIDEQQAHRLAEALGVPRRRMLWHEGVASFIDTDRYLAVPTISLTDPELVEARRRTTTNHYPEIPIEVRAIDYAALTSLGNPPYEEALNSVVSALDAADLTLAHATPVVGHTTFKTVSIADEHKAPEETKTLLDTHGHYRFTLEGYLLVGPGAQVQISFDHEGQVTRMVYSTRQLVRGPSVRIVPQEEIQNRFSCRLPDEAEIAVSLVYWAPPLRSWIGGPERARPSAVIPWYALTITQPVVGPRTGEQRKATSRVHLVPATDDARYVPTVNLAVTAPERSRVRARAVATGGTPPYTYLWAGSNPEVSRDLSASVQYEPVTRDLRPFIATQSLERTEQVCVTVVDANGVRVQAGASIRVTARPAEETHSSVTYGCESPNDPGPSGDGSYAPERIAWQQAMGLPGQGGGSQRFCWLEDSSWPGDYIEPSPPGSVEPSPWINGDADHSNWGINTTNIMLYNGDGNPWGFSEMYPGASTEDYNTGSGASLSAPGPGTTVGIGSQGYAVDYSGSWGAPHPRDNLQWLAMYACQILEDDSSAPDPWNRWGPAFNGLHSMLGFETTASDNGVGFMTDFPFNILGFTFPGLGIEVFPPQTVVQGWLNAAIANQMGTPAAMGPICNIDIDGATFGITNYNDFYWGKGPVGPTLDTSLINGWWYIQGSGALQEFP